MKNIRTVLIALVAVFLIADAALFVNYKRIKGEKTAAEITPTSTPFATAEPTVEPTLYATAEPTESPKDQDDGSDIDITPIPKINDVVSGVLSSKRICIDAGHGITDKKGTEAVSPGSSDKKAAHVSGASGDKITEEQFNLGVALKVKSMLETEGASVSMTRTTAECDLSNISRAELGNESDIMVRIHADDSDSSSVSGISMLVPVKNYFGNSSMVSDSVRLGKCILGKVIEATGAKDRGIIERSDLTGFNWSKVPVCLIECGFLSNASDEAKLADPIYQEKIARGITDGIKAYYQTNS